jgi:hypothetical protein
MWSVRHRVVNAARSKISPNAGGAVSGSVIGRYFSEKVSLNLHHTIAGRRRFYKHVGVEEINDTGRVSGIHTADLSVDMTPHSRYR